MSVDRYSRQIKFAGIGEDGQVRLANSKVLVIGCGALGCAQAEMLARAGVGTLRIVDRDFVELTNLHRQTLFSESDAYERLPKAVAAKRRLEQINSDVVVEDIVADINRSNIERLVQGCDLVIDGSDNFQVRYLVNDACVKANIPWIYGGAVSSYGMTMTILPGETACLRCVFADAPDAGSAPTCESAGVIMPIVVEIAAVQVVEALKLLVGRREKLHGTMLQIDLWENEIHRLKMPERDPECPACGLRRFDFLDGEGGDIAAVLCGRNAVQIAPQSSDFDLNGLADRLQFSVPVDINEFLLRFNAGENEITVFRDGRAIIKGTDDVSLARGLYARYVGV